MRINSFVAMATLAALTFSGCAKSVPNFADSGTFIPSPTDVQKMIFSKKSSNTDLLNQSEDKELTQAFLDKKLEKVTSIDHGKSLIIIEKKRLYETDSYIYLSKSRDFYRNLAFDFLDDAVSKSYINAVKKRGNGYIVYNGNGNEKILKALVGGSLKKSTKFEIFMYDSDFALIEYDKDGNKISALVRQARIEPSQLGIRMGDRNPAVSIHQRIFILKKSKVRKIDLNLGTTALNEFEYKKYNMPQTSQATNQLVQQPLQPKESKTDKIKELYELHKAGALSKEEFEQEKKKVLSTSTSIKTAPIKVVKTNATNPMELMIVQKFNKQYGTNFTTMKEVQQYMQNKQ